jgi:hypothetical protein
MTRIFSKFIICFVLISPFAILAQNPLKKEIKGGQETRVHYSPSQYKFTNYSGQKLFIAELKDNRFANWNKKIGEDIKIELVRDFWNYPYATLFKNKVNQDLNKSGVQVEFTPESATYSIEPQIEIHYPNYVVSPSKGYYVMTKLNVVVNKGSVLEFKKSYQDYYLFSNGDPEFKESFNSDFYAGTNTSMWVAMRRVLDKFYFDMNMIFGGQKVPEDNTPMEVVAKSNIANDPTLDKKQNSYSNAKDKTPADPKIGENNYKMEDNVAMTPPTDPGLDNAINALNTNKEKPSEKPVLKTPTVPISPPKINDSAIALRKIREVQRKAAIDSAMKIKEELALAAKKKQEEDKAFLLSKINSEKSRKDSILAVNKKILADKIKERNATDSIKRKEASQQIELARKRKEEERKKLIAKGTIKDSLVAKGEVKTPKLPKPIEAASKPAEIATSKPENTSPIKEANSKTYKPIKSDGSLASEMARIAREVELEDAGIKLLKPAVAPKQTSTVIAPTPAEREKRIEAETMARKAKLEAEKAKLEAEKQRLVLDKKAKEDALAKLKAEREVRLLRLEAERKAKDSLTKIEFAKKIEEKRLAAIKPIDPKKMIEDSMKLEESKRKRREAILAAQKMAIEAERNELEKNPNAGELYASISSDPPSKLPDNRTREQILSDRIFTPKTEVSKSLLNRVKLITPEEEMRMLQNLKTNDVSSVDSFYIEYQKNRPLDTAPAPQAIPNKLAIDSSALKSSSKKDLAKDKLKSKIKDTAKQKVLEKLDPSMAAKKAEIIKRTLEETKKVNDTAALKKISTAKTPNKEIKKKSFIDDEDDSINEPAKADKMNDAINKKAEELKQKAIQETK